MNLILIIVLLVAAFVIGFIVSESRHSVFRQRQAVVIAKGLHAASMLLESVKLIDFILDRSTVSLSAEDSEYLKKKLDEITEDGRNDDGQ